jgi:hypothetical protein
MPDSWSQHEVELVVSDYFAMYTTELRQEMYNKSAHRRALALLLDDRPDGAIERKHQNISAILVELNMPYISGYKPLGNYQRLLRESVENYVQGHPEVPALVAVDVDRVITVPTTEELLRALVAPPNPTTGRASDGEGEYRARIAGQINYLEREARNASLGEAGERFAVNFEMARLVAAGKEPLADRVERVSETRGDGLGFDVLSFDDDGRERFVEVKTTKYGKETPFFVTRNEVRFSSKEAERYRLYRLFEFCERPRMFELAGALEQSCALAAESFRAQVG